MNYTPGSIRKALSEYQRHAQGALMRPPEDRLGTKAPPLEEAPWAASSCLWADIETALRNLPFHHSQIVFMMLCLGKSSWSNGAKPYTWRMRVADWWGRGGNGNGPHSTVTPGDINKIVKQSLEVMADSLNGVAVDNSIPD